MLKEILDVDIDELDILSEDIKNMKVIIKNDKNIEHYRDISSKKPLDYQKNRWNSNKQMYSGIKMSEKIIDYKSINSWIDIGCGTGNFFEYILPKYKNIKNITCVDAVKEFTEITSDKINKLNSNVNIRKIHSPIHDINITEKFNLVTLSGVLQVLDLDKIYETFDMLTSLVSENGQLWINTANYNFKDVEKRRSGGIYRFKPKELELLLKKYNFSIIDSKTYDMDSNISKDIESEFVYLYGKK